MAPMKQHHDLAGQQQRADVVSRADCNRISIGSFRSEIPIVQIRLYRKDLSVGSLVGTGS
jgi:hypothetical protein